MHGKRSTTGVSDLTVARSYIELERKSRWQRQVERAGSSAWSSGNRVGSRLAKAGLNAWTLSYWKWHLSRDARTQKAPTATRERHTRKPKLVELTAVSVMHERVEIELSNLRLR